MCFLCDASESAWLCFYYKVAMLVEFNPVVLDKVDNSVLDSEPKASLSLLVP